MHNNDFDVDQKFQELRNELVNLPDTALEQNAASLSLPCDPSNTHILAIYGWDDDRTNFSKELASFMDILRVPKEYVEKNKLTFVDGSNKGRLNNLLGELEAPVKVIIYFGHGVGSGGSFAFDLLGGRIPCPSTEAELKQRYWFMKDLVYASINRYTEKVYLFIGACGSVGSDIVLQTYNQSAARANPPRLPLFYVRHCGVEVEENNITEEKIIHIPDSTKLSSELVLQTFAEYVRIHPEHHFLWGTDTRINVAYTTGNFFTQQAEELLLHQQKERNEFLALLSDSSDLVQVLECKIRNFSNNERMADVQWETKNKQQNGKYEVHAHFRKNDATNTFENTRIHIKSGPKGETFLNNEISKEIVQKLMALLPLDSRKFSIEQYVPKKSN